MKFVIHGKNGLHYKPTALGQEGKENEYDTFEEAQRALDQLKQTMPFLQFEIVSIVPHGGKREGAGRPSLGTTKKVSLTLPDEVWENIEQTIRKTGSNQSKLLRTLIEAYFKPNQFGKEIEFVPIEKDLLKQIQKLSKNTNEIYEDMDPEEFIQNILNTEYVRLKMKNGSALQ